jgi:hypothetical protein
MVMGMNQYAVFRSSDNFKDCESFIPERWLDDERFKDDKKDALQPFGPGTYRTEVCSLTSPIETDKS